MMKGFVLFFTILTACLLCLDATSGLSFHWLTASLLTAFLFSWPTAYIPNRLREVVQFVLGEMVLFVCLVDVYCQELFASSITPQILSNVLLSDAREVQEFLSTFIGYHVLSYWRIFVLVLLVLLLPVGLFFQRKHVDLPRTSKKIVYVSLGLLFLCVILEACPIFRYSQLFFQNRDYQKMEGLIFRHYHEEVPTPLHRFLFSYYALNQSARVLEDIKAATLKAQIDSCSYVSPHIVLVIGESYNKHHSSLYGYPLKTTPLQQKRKEEGQLFVFTDVVSPWNITSNAFLGIFSLWEYGLEETVSEMPLLPILFKRADYEVNFFSNQYQLRGFHKGGTNQAGHFFLADREMSDSLFSFRNRKTDKYDIELVEQVVEHKTSNNPATYSLDIIHLIGQHFDYEERYPKRETVFAEKRYHNRDLTKDAKRMVMHYDNATYYDDMVLDSILSVYEKDNVVVLFVADHGEEVYDDQPVHGRLFQTPTPSQARYEFEVPMWIWCSESYRLSHPDVIHDIELSVNKPFLTDGLPQLLLSLAGISSSWNDESHNLLSPKYKCKPRIIGGDTNYDEIIKNLSDR